MKNSEGFTLLEVLITLVLALTCFLFMISIFPLSSTSLKVAENKQTATLIASNKISEFVHRSFEDIYSPSGSPFSFNYTAYNNGVEYTQGFLYDVRIYDNIFGTEISSASSSSSGLKRIMVKVEWNEMRTAKGLSMEELVAK